MSTGDLPVNQRAAGVAARVGRSLRKHGFRQTVRRVVRAANTAYREWRLGICTRGSIEPNELQADDASFGYQPIPYRSFDEAIRHVSLQADQDVFIDYGCGMGRAVILASLHPFRQVIGVERSTELCEIAESNIRRASSRLRCRDVSIANEDAREFAVPDDASVIFMFNPFDEPILKSVLERIRRSHQHAPRRITFIYGLPNCRHDVLLDVPWLQLVRDIKTIDADWQRLAIYETREK